MQRNPESTGIQKMWFNDKKIIIEDNYFDTTVKK